MDVNLSQNSISQGMQQVPNLEALLLQLGGAQQNLGQVEGGALGQGGEALHPSFASFLSAPVAQQPQNEAIVFDENNLHPSFSTILNEVELVDSPIKMQLPIQDAPKVIQETPEVETAIVAIQESDIELQKTVNQTEVIDVVVTQYKPVVLKVQNVDTQEEIAVLENPPKIENTLEQPTKKPVEVDAEGIKNTSEISIQVVDTNQIKMPLEALPINYVMSEIVSNISIVENEGEDYQQTKVENDDFEQVILKSLNNTYDKPKQEEFHDSEDGAVLQEIAAVEDITLPIKDSEFIDDLDSPKVIKLAEVSDVKLPVEVQFLTKKFENIKFDKPEVELLRSVANQVAVKVTELKQGDNRSMTVQLEPKQLGKIDIHMDFKANGDTKLLILTEKFMTFDLLQKTTQQLESILNDNGLKTSGNDISFGLRNENGSQHQHRQSQEAPVLEFTGNETIQEVVGRTHYLTMNDGSVNIII